VIILTIKKLKDAVARWLKRDAKILTASLSAGAALSLIFVAGAAYSETMQNGIASGVVRFHIRANSDSSDDQFLKLAVKNRILDEFEDKLYGADGLDDSKEIIFTNLPAIRECAEKEIQARGYSYPVKVGLVSDYFPTRHYGGVSLPTGEYYALRVDIGEAKGENWWCVMYPPLCYVEAGTEISKDTKAKFKETLGKREYELVTLSDGENSQAIKIKFKIVELWQSLKRGEPEKDLRLVSNYIDFNN
jgi:stage II sporulation protein R